MRYMMTSDVKTNLSSLINHQRSDMFSIDNISSLKTVSIQGDSNIEFEVNMNLIPMEFYRLIESRPNMFTVEKFDKKFMYDPKGCAYARYGITNLWRPLLILNRCRSAMDFNLDRIRYFNIENLSDIMAILIGRKQ